MDILPIKPAIVALAPMVRAGTTPLRLLSLKYGADLVYTEEIIDRRMMSCTRSYNSVLRSTDFFDEHKRLCLRVADSEKDRCIFQLGSANPQQALQAARKVQHDVLGIDLNAGCPKHFSTHGGMGAALLKTPNVLVQVLETLIAGLDNKNISCKIRVLPDLDETFALLERLLALPLQRLAIHTRTPTMKPSDPAQWTLIPKLLDFLDKCESAGSNAPKKPIILLNGDIFTAECSKQLLDQYPWHKYQTLKVGFMVARGAQWNPSVFRTLSATATGNNGHTKRLGSKTVVQEYLRIAAQYDMPYQNAKFVALSMWDDTADERTLSMLGSKRKRDSNDGATVTAEIAQSTPREQTISAKQIRKACRAKIAAAKNMRELLSAVDIEAEYEVIVGAHKNEEEEEEKLGKADSANYDEMCPYIPDLRQFKEEDRDNPKIISV